MATADFLVKIVAAMVQRVGYSAGFAEVGIAVIEILGRIWAAVSGSVSLPVGYSDNISVREREPRV